MIKFILNIAEWINKKIYVAIGLYIILPFISFYFHLFHNVSPNLISLSLFGLFVIRIIASIIVALHLISYIKNPKQDKQKRNKIEKKIFIQKLYLNWGFKFLIGAILIGAPLFLSQHLSTDYKSNKLANDNQKVLGKVIELKYGNGHMTPSGYKYEFYVNDSKYSGNQNDSNGKIGQLIEVTYYVKNPWINVIKK